MARCEMPPASIFFLKSASHGLKFAEVLPQEAALAFLILLTDMAMRLVNNRAVRENILIIERIHSLFFTGRAYGNWGYLATEIELWLRVFQRIFGRRMKV